jgi:ketosteroid isomerase-like protein
VSEAVADKLFAAIRNNDLDALRTEVYASDVQIWHNHERSAQDLEANLRVLGWLNRHLTDRRYEEVRRQPTPTGFVQQHVLRGTTRSGEQIDVPACLVVTIDAGRITRIDEYLDSAHVAALIR